MMLPDVSVLVHAHREDASLHDTCLRWLDEILNGEQAYAVSELVLSGFLRVVTHPRVFSPPSPLERALKFTTEIREQPHCVIASPGPRHWSIFTGLCRTASARGNLVPDAYFAALAIEAGCEWVTTDRDYSRFPGLRWRHPGA